MRRLLAALPLAVVLGAQLTGCGGTPEKPPPAPTGLQSLNRSARLAFDQDQYAQAATLYAAVLEQALAEDSPEAIVDARFNLALSQTYLGDYDAALAQVTQADAERARRALGPDPQLDLLRATILYRAGDPAAAHAVLAPLLQRPDLGPATANRAHFIAGLLAADAGDPDTLQTHAAAIIAVASPASMADHRELQGRLAALRGDVRQALRLLDETITMRAADRDFRGMTRALARAGDLAEADGQLALAGSYLLRAGRSAAQRAEPQARDWLERARELGRRSGDRALVLEASSILSTLAAAGDAS